MATTGNNVIFKHGSLSAYQSATKDSNTLYFIDDGQLYLGQQLIGRYYAYGDYSSADGKSWPEDNPVVGKLYIDTNTGEVREYVGGTGESAWKVVLKASELLDKRINDLDSDISVSAGAVLTGITQVDGLLSGHTEVVPKLSEITVSDATGSAFKSYQLYIGNAPTTGQIDIPWNTTIVRAAIGAANDTVSQTNGDIIGAASPSGTDVLHIVYKNPQLPSGQQYKMVNAQIDMVKDLDVVKSTESHVNTYTVMQGGSSVGSPIAVGSPIVVSDVTATSATANNTTTYTFNVGAQKLMDVDVPYVTMASDSTASVDTYTISQGNSAISDVATITVPKSVSVTKTTDTSSAYATTYTVNQGTAAVSESIVVPEIRLTSEPVTTSANNTTYTLLEGSKAKGTIVVPNVTVALSESASTYAFKTYYVQQNGTNVNEPIDIPAVTIDSARNDSSSATIYTISQGKSAISTKIVVPDITVTELSTATTGYLKTYQIKQGDLEVGNIDIPKDFLVKSGSVKTVETPDEPYTGAKKYDKYIDFVINVKEGSAAEDQHIYIPVNDLVDVYTVAQNATQIQLAISDTNEISATIVAESVGTTELANGAVTTAKIADANVTEAKLDTDLQNKIDGAVQTVKVNGTALTEDSNNAVNITVASGAQNGTIAVNGTDVAVTGLQSAAFTEVEDNVNGIVAGTTSEKLTTSKQVAEFVNASLLRWGIIP